MTLESMSDVTQVLQAVSRGEARAAEDLLPLVYDHLRRLAAARMAQESGGQTLQATALVHEAWLRLVKEGERNWQNRAVFFSAAAEAMRRILIENARRKSRLKRGGGGLERVALTDIDLAESSPDDRILMIDEALERLQAEDPEAAKLVVMKFFGGMTDQEAAENLGVTDRTVRRQWAYAKAWLLTAIQEMR
jgi:RNA polymerase sigma factor (TIGR02999 family)